MEKRKPHYDLITAQTIVARDGVKAFTGTALAGAKTLGLSGDTACNAVIGITPAMFYKSMTTHLSHAVWQGVSRPAGLWAHRLHQAHADSDGESSDSVQGEIT